MNNLLYIAVIGLAGCSQFDMATDQCTRQVLFERCMAALPAGPQATTYNDWDEVVEACRSVAYNHSRKPAKLVKPECYGGTA